MSYASTTAPTPGVARGYFRSVPSGPNLGALSPRAVIYLRVSTLGQVSTNRDAEGFSIPAQREACLRKIEDMGAVCVDEYIDAGESARSADRPQLQALLERLRTERDVDYVVVHKVDRLARNRIDDVEINVAIKRAGAHLVSVTENIDETPSGMLTHGILSTIAEFYSRNLATEIIKGLEQKVKKGGINGLASIGYLNVQTFDGESTKAVRTITVDSERAPLVRWAFEAYATGDYTVRQLAEALADQGLRTRRTRKRPSVPLRLQQVHQMLQNRIYVGLVKWKGTEYPGRHEALVSVEMFATVQAILHSRAKTGEKPSRHSHYLVGTLFCKRCGSGMGYNQATGNGGVYHYFFCWSRHRGTGCNLRYVRAELLEAQVAASYEPIQLTGERLLQLRDSLFKQVKALLEGTEKAADRARKLIIQLEAERRALLQAHLAGAVPVDLLREEQTRITRALAQAGGELANSEVDWQAVQRRLTAALGLVSQLSDIYANSDEATRKRINQAAWAGFDVDDDGVAGARLTDPMAALVAEDVLRALGAENADSEHLVDDQGSRLNDLVEVTGLEPGRLLRCERRGGWPAAWS
jgi:site-specific DNA recombinase